MKKSVLFASAVLTVAFLATMMLSGVRGEDGPGWVGYPGPDIFSRCTHTGTYGSIGDTFTAIGITAYYGYEPPAYVHGYWSFLSGYGGLYPADSSMICKWVYTPSQFTYYDSSSFVWDYRYNAFAYYRDWEKWQYNIPRAPSVSGSTASVFRNPSTGDRWYVSSVIYASEMTAGYP
jgi:hypothetical protein